MSKPFVFAASKGCWKYARDEIDDEEEVWLGYEGIMEELILDENCIQNVRNILSDSCTQRTELTKNCEEGL